MLQTESWRMHLMGWRAGRNPLSVLGDMRLRGPPASQVEVHRRLFALAPREAAVSMLPSPSSAT